MHPLDRLLFQRALALALVFFGLFVGLVVATDEAGSTLALRAARLGALAPAIAVLAEAIVLARSRERGEIRTLAALGTPPWRSPLGAIAAGWLIGIAATALLASRYADVSSLFPTATIPTRWLAEASGSLVDPVSGARVLSDGSVVMLARDAIPAAARAPGRAAALLCLAPLAFVAPVWGAAPLTLTQRGAGAFVAAALAVGFLHALAAGRVGPGILVLSCSPLVLQSGWAFGRTKIA
jgi:hypothetical protein